MIINIVAGLILFFSLVGGAIEGAVKSFFSLIVFIIAIPIAGHFYSFLADLLSFLPGQNWDNFIGFLLVIAIASIILTFIFYLPRKALEKIWKAGFLFRFIGGVLNFIGAMIGLIVFTYLISTYNVWDWLQQAMVNSEVIQWMVANLTCIRGLLPEAMRMAMLPTA